MIKPTPEALKRLAVYLKKGTAESSAVERLRVQLKDGRLPDAGAVAEAIEDWDALAALLLRSTPGRCRNPGPAGIRQAGTGEGGPPRKNRNKI